jgi:hypothetical protein
MEANFFERCIGNGYTKRVLFAAHSSRETHQERVAIAPDDAFGQEARTTWSLPRYVGVWEIGYFSALHRGMYVENVESSAPNGVKTSTSATNQSRNIVHLRRRCFLLHYHLCHLQLFLFPVHVDFFSELE